MHKKQRGKKEKKREIYNSHIVVKNLCRKNITEEKSRAVLMFTCLWSSYYVQSIVLGAAGKKEPENCALKNEWSW